MQIIPGLHCSGGVCAWQPPKANEAEVAQQVSNPARVPAPARPVDPSAHAYVSAGTVIDAANARKDLPSFKQVFDVEAPVLNKSLLLNAIA